jgi:hypothetical protein
MEIIFLVWILSLKGQTKIQKIEYHEYAEKFKLNIPCNRYIIRKNSVKEVRKRLKTGKGDIALHCVRSSLFEEWETNQMSKTNPIENDSEATLVHKDSIKPVNPPTKKDIPASYEGILGKVESTGGKSEMGRNGYQGTDYFLSISGDQDLPIHDTSAISESEFDKLVGKKVKVSGMYFEKFPNPMEQYPITYDPMTGKSMPIPRRGLRVNTIQALKD